jgi:hypothetical protein
MSCSNAFWSWLENTRFRSRLTSVRVLPPLFILGHYRSGTTHLHNLLSLDPQFAFPTFFRALNPHTFLTTEAFLKRGLQFLLPPTRVYDNMWFGFDAPAEEELALLSTSLLSHQLRWTFPRSWDHYERYLTLRDIPEPELIRWKDALVLFLRKLTWKDGRPLVLKTPPGTGRIRLLLELFPDARFVHIHRNPYAVFQSTKHMVNVSTGASTLQHWGWTDLDTKILDSYRAMYDAFFEEHVLIGPGRFHELAFRDLEQNPVEQLRILYDTLGLGGFSRVRPLVERYVASQEGYRKNVFPPLDDDLRTRIRRTWHRSFAAWHYGET